MSRTAATGHSGSSADLPSRPDRPRQEIGLHKQNQTPTFPAGFPRRVFLPPQCLQGGADVPSRRGCRTANGRPYVHRRNRDQIRRGGHCCPPLSIFPAPCRGRCPHAVRRRLLHSVSAGAAKTPYPQPPSSSPKGNRFTGLPFGFYIPAAAACLPLRRGGGICEANAGEVDGRP